jgi:hypothetical protein
MPRARFSGTTGGGYYGQSIVGNWSSFGPSKTGERTDDEKAEDVIKDLAYLATVRTNYEVMVDNIITFLNHSRRRITDKDLQPGQQTGEEVYDSSGISAVNIAVDGTVGNLCSRNQRWFRFGIPGKFNFPRSGGMRQWSGKRIDEYPEVKRWLQDCEDVQYSALDRSNWYDINTEFVRDGMTIGTAHLYADEDVGAGRINFTVPHFRECFIAENQFGRVDCIYRVRKMTLRQLVDKFGWERMREIDASFENDYNGNHHAERNVVHAVYPRKDYNPGADDGKNKPIASIWVLQDKKKLIEEKGYYSLPFTTWRWRKNNDEWYGRSPGWDCFVDIVKANQQGKSNLIAGQKAVEPPMVAYASLRGKINQGPRGMTFIDDNGGPAGSIKDRAPFPLMTGIQLPYGVDQQERTQKIIEDAYAKPFFMALTMALQDKVEMTATQVQEVLGERATVLCTRVGMLQSEGLSPMMDRTFEIETRAGRIPQPPQILYEYAGEGIEIQYIGPLAQIQLRMLKGRSIQSSISMAGQIAQISPEAQALVGAKVDWLKTIDEVFDIYGFPSSCIRSDEEVNQIMQAKLKAQQKQQAMENLDHIAKGLRAGAAKPEQGSPAQEMIHPEQSEQAPAGAGV